MIKNGNLHESTSQEETELSANISVLTFESEDVQKNDSETLPEHIIISSDSRRRGTDIRLARIKLEMSQETLAEEVDLPQLDVLMLRKIENGVGNPHKTTISRIQETLEQILQEKRGSLKKR
jgi:ribosome-binding protein aMBF1 (putative translation factor)